MKVLEGPESLKNEGFGGPVTTQNLHFDYDILTKMKILDCVGAAKTCISLQTSFKNAWLGRFREAPSSRRTTLKCAFRMRHPAKIDILDCR